MEQAHAQPHMRPRQIFDDACRAEPETGARLNFRNMESMITKSRRRLRPAQPVQIADVTPALEHYERSRLPGGLPFFRGEVVVGQDQDQRALLFASDRQLQCLSAAETVNCDGTFRVVPHNFQQLFTIYVTRDCLDGT